MSPQNVTLLSGAVILAYLLGLRWLDRYEREPLWSVLLVFVLGIAVSVPMTCVGYDLVDLVAGDLSRTTSAQLVAPVVEEFAKGLVLACVVATALPAVPFDVFEELDNETDGLIYGAAIGLGFALAENTMYYWIGARSPFISVEAVERMAVGRTFLSTLSHSASTAMIGMAVGYARYSHDWRTWLGALAEGYGLAVLAHALYNTVAIEISFEIDPQQAPTIPTSLIILVTAYTALLGVLTEYTLSKEHAMMQRVFEDEADRGTIPSAHADILPYWHRRLRSDWLDDDIPKHEYIRLATRLAFRRHQFERTGGPTSELRGEIDELREQILHLLAE